MFFFFIFMPKKITTEQFIKQAREIHGDKYNYSKVEYVNNTTSICIICPEHGEFWQHPNYHLQNHGCPKCGIKKIKESKKYNTEEFIKKAREVHGDKYDYSKVQYIDSKTKVCIICPEHGEFWQVPAKHLNGRGCNKCAVIYKGFKKRKERDNFIKEAKQVHGDKYDYSKVEYVNNKIKVCIICPEHGEFWQIPSVHLNNKSGCPKCNTSKLEVLTKKVLTKNNVEFEEQKTFDWLKYKNKLKLDFYLPDYNIAIECQGEQHFKKFRFEKDDKKLIQRVKRDNRKKELCEQNGIKIVYIDWNEKDIEEKIIKNLL